MNGVRFEWHGDEAKQLIHIKTVRFIKAICMAVKRRAVKHLSVAGTGRVKGKKVPGGKVTHAPKGEPPYKQTGRLRASITFEVDEDAEMGRVGTNVEYGLIHELMDHPFLRRSLDESQEDIDGITRAIGES
jgi:phage gpG-like protein